MAPRFKQNMYQTYKKDIGADALICFTYSNIDFIYPFRDKVTEKIQARFNLYLHKSEGASTKIDSWFRFFARESEEKAKGLLGKDPWQDGFQKLLYYLWHHTGRRARQGAAMNAPDYAHWHGFFQVFQVYQDMEVIYGQRMKNNKIEEVSTVVSSAPY